MDKQITGAKQYVAPTLVELGTVAELTSRPRATPPDKCGGSGDAALPTQLSNEFGAPHCSSVTD